MADGEARNSEKVPAWAYALWPLGVLFLAMSAAKTSLTGGRGRGINLGLPALSVGNLTFGGTGKTPFTIHLARRLQAMGCRPAVLLRGYGRATVGAYLVTPDSPPEAAGEEALLLARSLPGVAVAVAERREEGAALLADRANVLLLDDAFQHVRVRREVDLLLVDASRPRDLHAPPVGRLREPLRAARRADLVVVTRGNITELPAPLASRLKGVPRVGVRFDWASAPEPASPFGSWEALRGLPLVAFAGIGTPGAFFQQAREAGLRLEASLAWPDHARPNASRLQRLLDEAVRTQARAVLTTEKDHVKWAPLWSGPAPLLFPRLEARVEDPDGHLDRILRKLVGAEP
ncbi:MAG: tetraacyldisaccharide 4'-kinase [Acidobacteriota bacterium]